VHGLQRNQCLLIERVIAATAFELDSLYPAGIVEQYARKDSALRRRQCRISE